jgi:5'-deoxynucleotidase YfbR-like HD superfamily hydrolase
MNVRELLMGDVVRMRYVKRFGTCRVISPESVAEHVAFTSIYSALVARWVKQNHPDIKIDLGKLLERALFHDIEEVKTGDFPRPHKYSSPTLTLIEDTLELYDGWQCAKSEGYEGLVLAFADFLSAISFIAQEVLAGNGTMTMHVETCTEYIDQFKRDKFAFLRPLVDQAQLVMDEVFKVGGPDRA